MTTLSRFRRSLRVLAFVLPVAAATGCLGDTTAPTPITLATVPGTTFGTSLGIDLSTFTALPSGLYYKDLVVGTGATPALGDTVTVNYVLRLSSGTQIDPDPSRATVGTFKFKPGTNAVIPGFDEGVASMKVGGRRQLLVPPVLGYGAAGYGVVPGNAVLVFNVDLVSIP